jgi:hypothetical protein
MHRKKERHHDRRQESVEHAERRHLDHREHRKEKEREHETRGYTDSHLKPDETCHDKKQDMGTVAKKARLPGQMYVPQTTHNESVFVGEIR